MKTLFIEADSLKEAFSEIPQDKGKSPLRVMWAKDIAAVIYLTSSESRILEAHLDNLSHDLRSTTRPERVLLYAILEKLQHDISKRESHKALKNMEVLP